MVLDCLAKKLLGSLGGGPASGAAAEPAPATAAAPSPAPPNDHQQRPYAGVNCYYLLTRAADPGCRPMVEATLDAVAATAGLTIVRTWAFCDGASQWNALQPKAGELDERVFRALDWLLDAAGRRGLRLQLTLTNFWKEFGGLPQYVAWAAETPIPERGDAFFDDPRAQALYRAFVERVVTRVSTVTGRPYRDDPTIHAWDLVNEPRCDEAPAGGGGDAGAAKLARWLDETARLVKSLDPNHRVTAGLEGFFGPSAPDLAARANPYASASVAGHGADFCAAFASPHLDFCCIHLYPNQWLSSSATSDAERIAWAARWVDAHAEACASRLGGKPLCVQVRRGVRARLARRRSPAESETNTPNRRSLPFSRAHETTGVWMEGVGGRGWGRGGARGAPSCFARCSPPARARAPRSRARSRGCLPTRPTRTTTATRSTQAAASRRPRPRRRAAAAGAWRGTR